MKIASIEIQGFRGIKERINIDFGSGFTVISGRNGTGKSTICDAVEYALTGKIRTNSITEKGESILDYIWWCGKGKPTAYFVKLNLVDADGKQYEIHRTRDGLQNNIDLEKLLVNTKLAPTDSLNQLIKINIIRDEEITQTSIDLKEKDRFNFVRNSIGIENLDKYEQKAKELYNRISELINSVTTKYDDHRKLVTDLTSEASEIKAESFTESAIHNAENSIRKYLLKIEFTKSDLIKLANEKLSELIGNRNRLREIISESNSLSKQLISVESQEFHLKVSEIELKIKRLKEDIKSQEIELSRNKSILAELENQNPRLSSFALLSEHGKSLGLIDGKCPLCGSIITDDNFADHLFSIDTMVKSTMSSLSELVTKQKIISQNINETQTLLRKETFELENLLSSKKVIDNRYAELIRELKKLEIEIDIKDMNSLSSKINDFESKINELRNSINILEVSRSYEKVLEIERQIVIAKEEAENVSKQIQHLQVVQLKIKNDYDLIRRSTGEIIDERLAEISPLLTELYYRLRPHIEWDKIAYNIRGDISRFLSLRTEDDLNPNFIFSSGQRRAVGLAFLLAVHLSIQWSNLETLILDDPIQHVDDYRALHFVETLSSIRMSNKQVICTVEDPELANLLCRRLRGRVETTGKLVEMLFESGIGVTVKSEETLKPIKRDVLLAS